MVNFEKEPLLKPNSHDVLKWWKSNQAKYPILADEVRRYLAAPPTTVPSERLFSQSRLT